MFYEATRFVIPLVKVKFSMCLIKHHAKKTYGDWWYTPPFLSSALGRGEWSA
jgi:hypothetical protein